MNHQIPYRQRGLSLVELMISMVLGLLVVGGAIGVFLSNQQTYRATESLARVQENARVAFELMAREVREAAGNACGNNLPTANVLNNPGSLWWSNWRDGIFGYDNNAYAGSAAGTDAVDLISTSDGGVAVTDESKTGASNSAEFKVTATTGLEENDIVMVCDYNQLTILQITNVNDKITVNANTGNTETGPGNCTHQLGLPTVCGGASKGTPKYYSQNSRVARLKASRWYVADNGRGGRSLYRINMRHGVDGAPEEVTEGIRDMQIQYLVDGATGYVDASAGLAWSNVTAARITLTVEGTARVGTDGEVLTRDIDHVVTLRNRTS